QCWTYSAGVTPGAVLGLVLGLVLAAVAPAPGPAPSDAMTRAVTRAVLTTGGPAYHYRYDGRRLVVRAGAGSVDSNRRELAVPAGTRARRDQVSCATWARESSWRMQPGLAVRVADRGGRVRAVTLTKNVFGGTQSVMNVLTWDTGRRGDPWRRVGQFDLAPVLLTTHRRLVPLPWRACLRAQGRQLEFRVWPLGRVDPPTWDDGAFVRRVRLPRAAVYQGRPGWYVGHVPARGTAVYRGLRTGR
ncbi:MAG: hypothetical protein KDB43_14095, partial [Nocardioidaceae bacterium]|nr:hypothetical protein [Nocardioidaceae bacterium]